MFTVPELRLLAFRAVIAEPAPENEEAVTAPVAVKAPLSSNVYFMAVPSRI